MPARFSEALSSLQASRTIFIWASVSASESESRFGTQRKPGNILDLCCSHFLSIFPKSERPDKIAVMISVWLQNEHNGFAKICASNLTFDHLHWGYFYVCHSCWNGSVIMSEIVMRAPGCTLSVSVRASPARLHLDQWWCAPRRTWLHAPKPVSSGPALRLHPHNNALVLLYYVQSAVLCMPIDGREGGRDGRMCPYRWPTIPTCIAKHLHFTELQLQSTCIEM